MLKRLQILDSLRHPAFRLLWMTSFLSSICMNMQNPLLASIVMDLTESPFLFGIIMSLRFAPYLIGPMSGVLADRMDRHRLLLIFQAIQISLALFMGTLIIGGQIQLWHVTLVILFQSIIQTFNMPAQSAFIVDIVGKDNITNATALNWLTMSMSGLVGPSLVGAFVNYIGIGVFYYFNAGIYIIASIFLLMIRGTAKTKVTKEKSILKNLREGFKYCWSNRPVFGGQLIYFITNLFPIATRRTLMWVFARYVLGSDASGLGWLSTGNQIGSFIATSLIAQLGDIKGKGRIVVLSSLIWGITWILFSATTSFYLILVYLIILGFVTSLTLVLAQAVLLINSESEMRGRVMGIRSLMISSQFPGSIIAGAIAESWGEPFAVGLEGILFVISMLLIIKLVPSLRKTD